MRRSNVPALIGKNLQLFQGICIFDPRCLNLLHLKARRCKCRGRTPADDRIRLSYNMLPPRRDPFLVIQITRARAGRHISMFASVSRFRYEVSAMLETAIHCWAVRPSVILVATDLSDLNRLMPPAVEQAQASGARLILLHVLAARAPVFAGADGLPYYDTASALETADRILQTSCGFARSRGIRCDALVHEGSPSHQIAIAIRQFQADRVLIGTRGRSKLGRLFLGSVAEQVLRSVNIPVFTVGPEAHLNEAGSAERVVLLATTLRETSLPSAALACQIASGQNARLVLLHVLPHMDEMKRNGLPTGLDSAAMHELRRLAAETGAGCSTRIEPIVAHGNPSIEILAEAAARHAGLIVLGATQHSALGNLTRDRTVYRVLAHARCPVLTLREPQTLPAETSTEAVGALR
jgi:nucleotide-binding universal stress UspA family protein